ncbi:MAG: ribonuclease D [Acidimicrobiia bacterium]
MITDTGELDAVLGEFTAADAYALDTEFHREGFYYPRLALVQLAVPGRVVLIDATAVDVSALRPLLEGPGTAVAHAATQDLEVLDSAVGAIPGRLFDTQVAGGFTGTGSASLASLVGAFLGRRMAKGQVLSDWFRRPLSAEQLAYAAADVEHLLDLRAAITDRLVAAGRLDWALEECERQRRVRAPDVEVAWWRLRGNRGLRGKARGAAQELAAWRERTAMAADRPVRSVISDEALVAFAERPPRSPSAMVKTRFFDPRRLTPGAAEELVAAAARGAALPASAVRLPPGDDLPSHLGPLATLLTAWVAAQARSASIDPALLATRAEVEAFLRGNETRLHHGWREQLVGEALERIADGRAAVAADGNGSLVLVDR